MPLIRGFARILTGILLAAVISAAAMYAVVPRYRFAPPKPFSGDRLYNPYEALQPAWWKANFQVASASWGGLTAGKDSPAAVVNQYRKYGFDIISISDYQKINSYRSADPDYVPTYEHGYNVWKRHHLCVGARRVTWYDLPLGQSIHHKQFVLKRLRPHVEFLALAHPVWNGAFTSSDMQALTDYDAVEVLNHYRRSFGLWDAALTAGHLVWGLGDDDSHDIYDLRETMRCWTMVNAARPVQKDILDALKKGRSVYVDGELARNDVQVLAVTTDGMNVTVQLDTTADRIVFIGDHGTERAATKQTRHAGYRFQSEDSYIRIVVEMPNSKVYLNPIIRWNGRTLPVRSATVDLPATALQYGLYSLATVILVLIFRRLRRRMA